MTNDDLGEVEFVDAPNEIAFSETGAAQGMSTSIKSADLGAGRRKTICTQTNVPAGCRSAEAEAGMSAVIERASPTSNHSSSKQRFGRLVISTTDRRNNCLRT